MKQGRIKERKVDPVAELQPNTLQAPLIKPQLSHSYYVHKNKNYFMDWNLIVTIIVIFALTIHYFITSLLTAWTAWRCICTCKYERRP